MQKQLLGPKWDLNTPPYSFLWIRDFDAKTNFDYVLPIKTGEKISIKILEEKLCVGYKANEKDYVFCNKRTSKEYTQCFQCQMKDFSRCFVMCDPLKGQESCSNKEAYEYCKTTPRSVYLALIGAEIKVGISFHPLQRWVNQGADMAIEVWRAKNGLQARIIEQLVSSELGISQTINTRNKIQTLSKLDIKSLQAIRKLKKEVKELIKRNNFESVPSTLLDKEIFLDKYYGNIPSLDLTPIYIDLNKDPYINGIVVGMKGSLLVTKMKKSYYVFNIKEAIGHIISMTPSNVKIKRQQSLFNFI